MDDIYFLGGSPCSGKSTLAERLAGETGFAYFKIDDLLWPYMERGAREGIPILKKAWEQSQEEMWMRDPQILCDEEFEIYGAMFPYVLMDLAERRRQGPVITEGAALLPGLMGGQRVPLDRYICIVPTPVFQVEKYRERTWISEFLSECSDPKAAFDHWMERDALFAQRALKEARAWSYPTLVVDGSRSIEENQRTVEAAFGWTTV